MSCLDILIKKYGNKIFGRRRKKNQDKVYHRI
jgi:hypothetical protein